MRGSGDGSDVYLAFPQTWLLFAHVSLVCALCVLTFHLPLPTVPAPEPLENDGFCAAPTRRSAGAHARVHAFGEQGSIDVRGEGRPVFA